MARLLTLLAALGAHPLTGTGTNKCYEELWSLSQLTVTVIADYRLDGLSNLVFAQIIRMYVQGVH